MRYMATHWLKPSAGGIAAAGLIGVLLFNTQPSQFSVMFLISLSTSL